MADNGLYQTSMCVNMDLAAIRSVLPLVFRVHVIHACNTDFLWQYNCVEDAVIVSIAGREFNCSCSQANLEVSIDKNWLLSGLGLNRTL